MSAPSAASASTIESVLQEHRLFNPPADFSQRIGGAYIKSLDDYRALHKQSITDPEKFWADIARQLDWFSPWDTVLEWNCPDAKWFIGGKTNVCHNCLDRQINAGLGDQTAIIWKANRKSFRHPPA
jgi:acetyl-CoA synthetase